MDEQIPEQINTKSRRAQYSEKAMRVISHFSLTEKVIFFTFACIFSLTAISLLWQVNKLFLVEVPDYGGTLTEGIIGSPRFVNPLLAVSDIDKDLQNLIYSGLLRVGEDGDLIEDLAESYSISEDGLNYTFVLRDNIYFHDGTKVTAEDVAFTIALAQDPALKSPREANWSGVKVTKIDDKTIEFGLKQPYAPFIQNATLGILPKHIWKSASIEEFPFSQFNINAIGTGPYKVDSISYTSGGLPSEYKLIAFDKYSLGKPYISRIIIKSYKSEKEAMDAYKNGTIESLHDVSPEEVSSVDVANEDIILYPLPRVFGVFFNQNSAPVLAKKEVRQALEAATDKQEIIDEVLSGYGQAIEGPIPPRTVSVKKEALNETLGLEASRVEVAEKILMDADWEKNENGIFEKTEKGKTTTLSFALSTGDAPELKATAVLLQSQWAKIGAYVEVKIFEIGDLNQNIIRPRKYDALLFGEVIGREMDLYPFWHSSQRNDPGLNIAMYTNLKADKILENMRTTTDPTKQKTYFSQLSNEIKNDIPAVFTYSPYFIYLVPQKVKNVSLGILTTSSERFNNVSKWYIETDYVWKIFANK